MGALLYFFAPYVLLSYQEVLLDVPPIAECEAKCALFYSISSTQVNKVFKDYKYQGKYCASLSDKLAPTN